MLDSLALSTPIAAIIAGGLLLIFGRRLFWLFVGVVGFVVAYRLAGAYLGSEGAGWAVAIAAGVLGGVAAVLVQKLVVTVAGFAAGAVGFVWITEQLDWAPGLPTLVGARSADSCGRPGGGPRRCGAVALAVRARSGGTQRPGRRRPGRRGSGPRRAARCDLRDPGRRRRTGAAGRASTASTASEARQRVISSRPEAARCTLPGGQDR